MNEYFSPSDKLSKFLLITVSVLCFGALNAAASLVYSTDFTSADGFVEATNITGIDGWSAQNGVISSSVASNGEIQYTSNSFVRAFRPDTVFGIGDTLTVTASIKSIGGGSPGFEANLYRIGLDNSIDLGGGAPLVGATLGGNSGGISRLGYADGSNKINSIAIDTDYHTLTTSITKSATANTFDVVSSYAGTIQSYSITNATIYGAATVNPIFQSQGVTNTGGVAVDSVQINLVKFAAVPEPTTAGILGALIGLVGLTGRRRRQLPA